MSAPARVTKQRLAISAAVAAASEFRSAQQWHDSLKADGLSVGLATVYRTLQTLVETGEVDAVTSEGGETLFRGCGSAEAHHHHLRCRQCGAAEEVDLPQLEAWAREVAAAHGYTRIDHTLELTGLCGACLRPETR